MCNLKVIMLFISVFLGCEHIKFAKGVKDESSQRFKQHKLFLTSFAFIGEVIEKKYCEECNYNKYVIKIRLSNANLDTVNIGFRSYEPYYKMENETISISVNKKTYDNIDINTKSVKVANSKNITINSKTFIILSEQENMWFD
jgi:hypothetical protein